MKHLKTTVAALLLSTSAAQAALINVDIVGTLTNIRADSPGYLDIDMDFFSGFAPTDFGSNCEVLSGSTYRCEWADLDAVRAIRPVDSNTSARASETATARVTFTDDHFLPNGSMRYSFGDNPGPELSCIGPVHLCWGIEGASFFSLLSFDGSYLNAQYAAGDSQTIVSDTSITGNWFWTGLSGEGWTWSDTSGFGGAGYTYDITQTVLAPVPLPASSLSLVAAIGAFGVWRAKQRKRR